MLQDQVEPIPLEQVHAQIRDSLGKEVQELFATIDPTPLAAASIAQVHRAVTLCRRRGGGEGAAAGDLRANRRRIWRCCARWRGCWRR